MRALARLCRLHYVIPFPLAYLLTVFYARGGDMAGQWPGAWLSAGALALVLAGVYALNDVCDRHVDRANASARPIPAGSIRPLPATIWAGLLLAGGLLAAWPCRPAYFAALSMLTLLLLGYDVLSKRLGVFKQVWSAAMPPGIYLLAYAQAGGFHGPRAATLLIFPLWLGLTAFGYELLKDLRDRAGDPGISGRPTPLQRNPSRWRAVASITLAGASLLLVGPALLGCGWVYLAGASVAMALAWLAARADVPRAIHLIYAECFLVGVAATLDVLLGM